jgi:hypothetical protein
VEVVTDDDTPLAGLDPKHIRYLFGYPDGRVGPEGSLTRAEMCMLLFRLLAVEDKNDLLEDRFPDVKKGAWYYQAVTYLAHTGVVSGYPDGSFQPERQITRAEFVTMAARFDELGVGGWGVIGDSADNGDNSAGTGAGGSNGGNSGSANNANGGTGGNSGVDGTGGNDSADATGTNDSGNANANGKKSYPDIAGHWAQAQILNASDKGWTNGYPDGTFRPQSSLTRAEAVTIVNRIFDRRIEKSDLPDWTPTYTDLATSHWAYTDLMEASTGHGYQRKTGGGEIWTQKLPD